MSLSSRILDRLVLKPTRQAIDPDNRRRQLVQTPVGTTEVWIYEHVAAEEQERTIAIKFPGAGGRGEKGGPHPIECWPHVSAEIWVVNMPGYGGSSGQATLKSIPIAARCVWNAIRKTHADQRPLVIGNSFGCCAALFLAAHFDVSAVLLRNPVPLKELILGRHSWWNAGILARWLTRNISTELDAALNASRCRAPALFFQSARDTLVPTSFQNLIIDSYAGPKRVFVASQLDHHDVLPESLVPDYRLALEWLNKSRRQG